MLGRKSGHLGEPLEDRARAFCMWAAIEAGPAKGAQSGPPCISPSLRRPLQDGARAALLAVPYGALAKPPGHPSNNSISISSERFATLLIKSCEIL